MSRGLEQVNEPSSTPAVAGSPLAGLRARRTKAVSRLYLDLPVPGLEPLHIRFRPVESAEIDRVNKQHAKSVAPGVDVVINAVLMTYACVGIYDMPEGHTAENPPPLDEAWPKFDESMVTMLGLPEGSQAVAVVRGLFLTDGDLLSASRKLAEWSGYALDQVDREYTGN